MSVVTSEHQFRLCLLRIELFGQPNYTVEGGFIDTEAREEVFQADVREEVQHLEMECKSNSMQKKHNDIGNFFYGNLLSEVLCRNNYAAQVSNAYLCICLSFDPLSLSRSFKERCVVFYRFLARHEVKRRFAEYVPL